MYVICLIFGLITLFCTKAFCIRAKNTRLVDKPNWRSLHVIPTVRGGGLIFISVSLSALLFFARVYHYFNLDHYFLFLSIFLVAAVSFIDDLFIISAKSRFLVQSLVATLIILTFFPSLLNFGLFVLSNPYVIAIFLFLIIVWAINLFNFMDGMDGFCATQSLFLMMAYGLLFHLQGDLFFQAFCWTVGANLIAFLMFNFPPAKLFMGDVGSAALGLISISIAIIAQQKHHTPFLYWFILNGLFLFDATITLLRRIYHQEKWFTAHCKHAYQRLRQSGCKAQMILLGQFILNSIFLVVVLLMEYKQLNVKVIVFLQIGLILGIYMAIEKLFPMYSKINVVKLSSHSDSL